ncbi:hypothetical protein B0H11DRAFT_2108137 [Mycena galericulata]|nr:hypothetical protein B0H11DRAFT_2108137 [Mycena galericulata]
MKEIVCDDKRPSPIAGQEEQCGIAKLGTLSSNVAVSHISPAHGTFQCAFLNTVMSAYSIRPDDIWLATVAQISFYVTANAELVRLNFVAHDGKELDIKGNILPDFGVLTRQLEALIHKIVVDWNVRDWILTKFSPTTINDPTIALILMMATMKKYVFPLRDSATGLGTNSSSAGEVEGMRDPDARLVPPSLSRHLEVRARVRQSEQSRQLGPLGQGDS